MLEAAPARWWQLNFYTFVFFAYSLGRRRRDDCCSIPSSNSTDSGSAVPLKPMMRVPKKVCFSFFQLEWSERYLFVFSALFCQGKTKRFAYQITFASEHQNNSLICNKTFCFVACVGETKGSEEQAASVFLLQKSCDAPGTELQPEGPALLKGFESVSAGKAASHHASVLSLDSWCFSIYKNQLRSCKYRWKHTLGFFTLIVKALQWGDRIILQISAGNRRI